MKLDDSNQDATAAIGRGSLGSPIRRSTFLKAPATRPARRGRWRPWSGQTGTLSVATMPEVTLPVTLASCSE